MVVFAKSLRTEWLLMQKDQQKVLSKAFKGGSREPYMNEFQDMFRVSQICHDLLLVQRIRNQQFWCWNLSPTLCFQVLDLGDKLLIHAYISRPTSFTRSKSLRIFLRTCHYLQQSQTTHHLRLILRLNNQLILILYLFSVCHSPYQSS